MHAIRKALGEAVLLSEGEALRLDPAKLRIDTLEFEAAFEGGDYERAVSHRAGPFLDGFSIPDAVEFDQWADVERERLERIYHASLEKLAARAEAAGDAAAAAEYWRRRLACTPADGRVVIRLMQALADAGGRANALQVAANHSQLIAAEFDAPADPAVSELEERLRTAAAGYRETPPAILPSAPRVEQTMVPAPGLEPPSVSVAAERMSEPGSACKTLPNLRPGGPDDDPRVSAFSCPLQPSRSSRWRWFASRISEAQLFRRLPRAPSLFCRSMT